MKGRLKRASNNKKERLERLERFKSIGIEKIADLTKRELFILGSGLYWAEGCKKHRTTTFTNSDPKMILIYLYLKQPELLLARTR